MYRATSSASLSSLVLREPGMPLHASPNYYQRLHLESKTIFFDYFKKYEKYQSFNIDDCKYMLNNMELLLLMWIQATIATNIGDIFDMSANLKFFSEIFFLRQTKIILKIPRDDDFTTKFSDRIHPTIQQLILKINPEAHYQLFVQPLTAQLSMMGSMHAGIFSCLEKLMTDMSEHKYKQSFNILIHAPLEALDIKKILDAYLGSEQAFAQTLKGLQSSVSYRTDLKIHFESTQDYRFKQAFDSLSFDLNELATILNTNTEFDLSEIEKMLGQPGLSTEEAMVLETEKCRLKSSLTRGFLSFV